MPERHVVNTFVSLVESGRFIEALHRFYHPSAVVWENQQRSRIGLEALIDNENLVLNAFTSIKGHATRVLIEGDDVAINWRFDFSNDGAQISLDEVAVQQWRDGMIVHERFYYDPAQLRPAADQPATHEAPRAAASP